MIERVTGNLLEASVEALVNTVNTVGVMGKGIALQFKKAFPQNFSAYKRECDAGRLEPGKVFVYDTGRTAFPRYIINFPTKRHWRSPSTLEYVESGLVALIEQMRLLNIRSIALPPLGCGNGGLDWSEVYPRIEKAFASLPEARVLVYEPAGAPAPERMTNLTKRPAMTMGRAAVLALMSRYLVPGYDYLLSLLEIQKLAYFMQAAGQPLKLDYKKGPYGPYADNLRHVLNHIEGHFIQGFGDGRNKPDTPISLRPGAAKEAEDHLAEDPVVQQRLERVARLIEGFETPYGMELLSSVHWVIRERSEGEPSLEATVRAVHAWNDRKAAMMKPEQICAAWTRLREHGWL